MRHEYGDILKDRTTGEEWVVCQVMPDGSALMTRNTGHAMLMMLSLRPGQDPRRSYKAMKYCLEWRTEPPPRYTQRLHSSYNHITQERTTDE